MKMGRNAFQIALLATAGCTPLQREARPFLVLDGSAAEVVVQTRAYDDSPRAPDPIAPEIARQHRVGGGLEARYLGAGGGMLGLRVRHVEALPEPTRIELTEGTRSYLPARFGLTSAGLDAGFHLEAVGIEAGVNHITSSKGVTGILPWLHLLAGSIDHLWCTLRLGPSDPVWIREQLSVGLAARWNDRLEVSAHLTRYGHLYHQHDDCSPFAGNLCGDTPNEFRLQARQGGLLEVHYRHGLLGGLLSAVVGPTWAIRLGVTATFDP